jgi:hypothetical protein
MSPEKFFKLIYRVVQRMAVGLVFLVLDRSLRPHLDDSLANITKGFLDVPVLKNLLTVLRSDDLFFRRQAGLQTTMIVPVAALSGSTIRLVFNTTP